MKHILTLSLCFLALSSSVYGQNNYSLSFEGDDYIEIIDNDIWSLELNNFTVSTYININYLPSQPSPHVGIIQQFENNDNKWQIYLLDNELYFGIKSSGVWNEVSVPWTPQLNTWQYISCVREDNVITFYINGQEIGSISAVINAPNISGSLNLGRYEWDTDWTGLDGYVDNLEFWNIALSQAEIQQYMNCPPTGNESGIVGYWNFDEGEGDTVYDLSENGNDGTINGATWSTDVPEQSCQSDCTDFVACNYNPDATEDDGSCDYTCCPGPGCCNIGMTWNWELGICETSIPTDSNLDGCTDLNDLMNLLGAYGICGES